MSRVRTNVTDRWAQRMQRYDIGFYMAPRVETNPDPEDDVATAIADVYGREGVVVDLYNLEFDKDRCTPDQPYIHRGELGNGLRVTDATTARMYFGEATTSQMFGATGAKDEVRLFRHLLRKPHVWQICPSYTQTNAGPPFPPPPPLR